MAGKLQYSFGTGALFGTSTNANSTPMQFGALQDVEVDFSFTTKELYSGLQFPIALARGTAKISGKCTYAQINARVYNDLFFNEAAEPTTGQLLLSLAENHSIPSSSPYTITVTNSGTFVDDLGVTNAATGQPLILVSSSPTTGQYAVNVGTGVYTFAAADDGLGVNINYAYTANTGQTLTITNQALGSAAYFSLTLNDTFQNNQLNLQLYQCMSDKLTMPFKLEDFMLQDFEFSAFANSAGQIGTISTVA